MKITKDFKIKSVSKSLVYGFAVGFIGLFSSIAPASAGATDTFTGGGGTNANWSNASNWSAGVPVAGTDLIFGTGGFVANNDLGAGFAVDSLMFNSATAYTLTGNSITLGPGLNNPPAAIVTSIYNDATGSQTETINTNLSLVGGGGTTNATQWYTVEGDTTVVNGSVALNGTALYITGAGSSNIGETQINGQITGAGHSGNSGAVIVGLQATLTPGYLILSNDNNSYTRGGATDATSLVGGTLVIEGNTVLGSGSLGINNAGTAQSTQLPVTLASANGGNAEGANITLNNVINVGSDFIVAPSASGSLDLAGSINLLPTGTINQVLIPGDSNTTLGTIVITNTTAAQNNGNNGALILSGPITQGPDAVNLTLNGNGTGGLFVFGNFNGGDGVNTYTGTTSVVNDAVLDLNDNNFNEQVIPGNLYIDSTSTVNMIAGEETSTNSTVTVNGTLNASGQEAGPGSQLINDLEGTNANAQIILGANFSLQVNGGNYAGKIEGNVFGNDTYGGSLVKESGGTLVLSGVNTYSGFTNVQGGTLQAGTDSGSGHAFSANSDFTLTNSAVLDLNGNNETIASLQGTMSTVVTDSSNGPATLTVNDANSSLTTPYEDDGTITDAGTSYPLSLTKQGPGTLILTNANSYHGSTTITGGTLQVSADDNLGVLTGPVVFNGTGTLENTASFASSRATIISSAGNSGTFLTDAGTMLTWNGQVSGGGSLIKSGTGTLYLTNTNTYTGGTTIKAGTLVAGNPTGSHVSTALGTGSVTVGLSTGATPATLETTASLNGVSTEKIVVGGSYTQNTNGNLLLQVVSTPAPIPSIQAGLAGTNYDTVAVTGGATVGGTLDLNFGGGSAPSQGQRYVVLTAGTPVAGQYADSFGAAGDTTGLPAGIYTVTTYNDNFGGTAPNDSVIITLVKPFTALGGLTANQTSVAQSVDSSLAILDNNGTLSRNTAAGPVGPGADFFNNIVTGLNSASYSPGQLGAALDQLSPQRFEILRNIAFDNNALDVQSLDGIFARERNGPGGSLDTSGLSFNDPTLGSQLSQVKGRLLAWDPPAQSGLMSDSTPPVLGAEQMSQSEGLKEVTAGQTVNTWSAFIDGGADLGNIDSNNDTNSSSYTTGRVRGGIDYHVSSTIRVGALFGYSHTQADLDNEGSTAKVNSYMPGLFATYADDKGFYANAIFSGGVNNYNTSRDIMIPGVSRTATASPSGTQLNADLDGGYDFHMGGWTFGPSAGLSYVDLGIDSFSEGGAGSANLNVNSQSTDSLRSRLGGMASYQAKIGSILLTPYMSAFWQHEFLNDSTLITSQFEGLPGGSFSVQTTKGDSDNALLGFGLNADLTENIALFIDYQAEAGGSTYFGQTASGGLKYNF